MENRKNLMDRVEQGLFQNEILIRDLINFLSESDVEEFCAQYGYEEETEEEETEEEETDCE